MLVYYYKTVQGHQVWTSSYTIKSAQSPFLPGKLPDETVGPKPHSGLLRLRPKGTNQCRIRILR